MCFFIIARLKMQVYLCNCRFVTALKSYRVNTLFRDYRKSLSLAPTLALCRSLARSHSRSPPSLCLIIFSFTDAGLTLKQSWSDVVQRRKTVVSTLCNVDSKLFQCWTPALYHHCSTLFIIHHCSNSTYHLPLRQEWKNQKQWQW